MLCDELCRTKGTEIKNKMLADATKVSIREFVKHCIGAKELFKFENNMADDPSAGFFKSNIDGTPVYYMQYCGFEYIFMYNYKTNPGSEYWID